MTNKFALAEQKELFVKNCKLVDLRYEYEKYTGKEKWAIVTELSEEELKSKYPDVIRRYAPFVLLSVAQGKAITEYQNAEAKERMRKLRFGHPFDINDGVFEEHHPELVVKESILEQICLQEEKQLIREAIDKLTDIQKRRIIAYYFEDKSIREIAAAEGVNISKIEKSISLALKKLKIFLSEGGYKTPLPVQTSEGVIYSGH